MTTQTMTQALSRHWPEYLIEAWALGMFMISAGLVGVLLESPTSPVRNLVAEPDLRRAFAGLAMGVTAISIIYSRWGQRSGAHMNPAVTATFFLLGKTRGWDAVFYVIAQFLGGLAGVGVVVWIAGGAFTSADVNYVATLPGRSGVGVAFGAEVGISALMMSAVLAASSRPRWAPYTGLVAGILVACFIFFEAPLSGMSMNPARSFASALPAGLWSHLWLYFTAPVLGMAAAAALHTLLGGRVAVPCAKLLHPANVRCIHCGYEPAPAPQLELQSMPIRRAPTAPRS